jgi:hypothetical protein
MRLSLAPATFRRGGILEVGERSWFELSLYDGHLELSRPFQLVQAIESRLDILG